jgi:hypothetical protein
MAGPRLCRPSTKVKGSSAFAPARRYSRQLSAMSLQAAKEKCVDKTLVLHTKTLAQWCVTY